MAGSQANAGSSESAAVSPPTESDLERYLEEYGIGEAVVPAWGCPEGCLVEPDGACPHGFESLLLAAGLL
jgi:hypothetical protein